MTRSLSEPKPVADAPRQLIAAHIGHVMVRDDEFDIAVGLESRNRLKPGTGFDDHILLGFQEIDQDLARR